MRGGKLLIAAALFTVPAVVLGLTGAVALTVSAPQAAQAATYGPGYSQPGSLLGAMVAPDGTLVYCIDPGAPIATGATSDAGLVTSVTSVGAGGANATVVSGQPMAGLDYVVSRYGQTSDNNQAAAVALTVWTIANPAAFAAETHPYGDNYKLTLAPASQRAAIEALATEYRAEAAAYVAPSTTPGTATMHFDVDTTNNYNGSLVIDTMTVAGTGTLTLTKGIFTTTGTNTLAGPLAPGDSFPVHGAPADTDVTYSIHADMSATGGSGYGANVHLWTTGSAQKLISGGATSVVSMAASTDDPQSLSTTFQPVATTQASTVFVKTGDDLSDVIQPATAADVNGLNNSWPTRADGTYRTITYNVVAYGPYNVRPAQATATPAGAHVAGSTTLSTGTTGPTMTYTATLPHAATAPGYYTFVVSVSYEAQNASTQVFLPGPSSSPAQANYEWSAPFAEQVETQFALPTVTTKAQSVTAPLGTVTDTATVAGQVPAEGLDITFKGYLQPSGSTTDVCDSTTLLFTSSAPVQADTAGDFTSELFTVPTGTSGAIDWVETTIVRGTTTVASTGTCGDPSERTTIAQPTAMTSAPTGLRSGATTHDVVTVNGFVPTGTSVVVSLYKQSTDAAGLTCTAGTLVSVLNPVTLTAGLNDNTKYSSPSTGPLSAGSYGFVEQLIDTSGAVISTGGCQDELFPVAGTKLALTGANAAAIDSILITGGVLVFGGGAILIVAVRRRWVERIAERAGKSN